MNIKINKEQSDQLFARKIKQQIIGSGLYGTQRPDSDTDFLIIYEDFHKSNKFLPNYHQFQYDTLFPMSDDILLQYIFTSETRFWANLFSGDSIINADVILDDDTYDEDYKLNILKTYNIIKAFLGFGKRDIRMAEQGKGKNKIFHAQRCLDFAECLLNDRLPDMKSYKNMLEKPISTADMKSKLEELRKQMNADYESNKLTMYPLLPLFPADDLEQLLIDSNNIKEFHY